MTLQKLHQRYLDSIPGGKKESCNEKLDSEFMELIDIVIINSDRVSPHAL
jgi:hypothetical protein